MLIIHRPVVHPLRYEARRHIFALGQISKEGQHVIVVKCSPDANLLHESLTTVGQEELNGFDHSFGEESPSRKPCLSS